MRIVDEGFEGTGYEESWAETISGGNTLDEDSTTIACLGTQSLKAITTSVAAPSAHATRTFGNVNAVYLRAWIYISENGLTGASEIAKIFDIRTSSGTSATRIELRNNAGTFQMRFIYYSNGGEVITTGVTVVIDTWYLIEFQYDTSLMLWGWILNNTVQETGHLEGTVRTPNRLVAGIVNYTGTAQSTVHIDAIAIDTEHYPSLIDSSDPIILEVPSTTILFDSRLYIKEIKWVRATTAGHTVVLQNRNGRTLWASEAAGDNFVDIFLYEGWVEGLSIPTLASGKVYVQVG
ncbi:MAG: hypothetical protein A2W23_06320 [Planctomycetes bacterium RBG_16_43_13]|nr:MAG: hypothetical protein A2W23_06320 [Planctomycetes bacterium RBG_16_43_13]